MKTLVSRYDKKLIGQLPKVLFQGRIIVIQSIEDAKKAVKYLLSQKIIGIDTETKPSFKRGSGMNPVALLQISTPDTCFLFRLNQIGLTEDIIALLSSNDILKVGLSLKDDFHQLCRRKDFVPGEYIELQSLALEMGIADQSLQKLYANFFGQRISKTQQLTNWEADVLTEAQKRYAATDAWACIQIYEEMQQLDKHGYMLEIIPEPESQCAPVLTEEERAQKEERRKEREREKRRRKRQREKEQRSINARRKGKERLKELLIS